GAMFSACGWRVIELRWGRRLRALFGRPGGGRLERRLEAMSNAEYQRLLRLPAAAVRKALVTGPGGKADATLDRLLAKTGDDEAEWVRRLSPLFTSPPARAVPPIPLEIDEAYPAESSTQEAFGRTLGALARLPGAAPIVTVSADVAVTTPLAGWINWTGVYFP